MKKIRTLLWIVFRFCIFVLWTQFSISEGDEPEVVNCFQILYIRSLNTIVVRWRTLRRCCELFSDFVYSFFEHNELYQTLIEEVVVNCFQILYIRSLNTIRPVKRSRQRRLWIVFRFCIFVLWTQYDYLII